MCFFCQENWEGKKMIGWMWREKREKGKEREREQRMREVVRP